MIFFPSRLDIDDLNKEMIVVKECYLAVCKEKDEQASILKAAFVQEQHQREEKVVAQIALVYYKETCCKITGLNEGPEQS